MRQIILLSFSIVTLVSIYIISRHDSTSSEEVCLFPQIYSINEVQDQLNQADDSTFVFFDCDDTLISAQDYLPRHFVMPTLFRVLAALKHRRLIYDRAYGEKVFSLMLEKAPRFLIEPAVTKAINKLYKQGAHVLAITGMETGSFGNIKSMPEWRANMLKEFGVNLSNEFKDTTFDNLKPYRNNYPVLHSGLICCNQRFKSEVIMTFFDHFKLKPETIILFDDSHEELVSLQEECNKRSITALCYHYKAASQIKHQPWSTWQALKQLDYLLEHEQWISDDAIRAQT
ncbi:DUF2608 domain-containing protein [Candidatus Dependentiae bacterium]|jgi:hypothetical protein|nr:DUF2608 domain-containing protein [Candidatus Dependentiae bacterium]